MPDQIPIKRALVSVYDKTGLETLVRGLHDAGVALVSTGGSAALIEGLGLPVTKVEDLTGFPECLDGRVKTLHPKVHAGILADRRLDDHVQQLADLGVEPFDLVVVNLYPFTADRRVGRRARRRASSRSTSAGPSMVRAAAKNHPSVGVVTSPGVATTTCWRAVAAGGFTLEQRKRLAAEAFVHTATYDVAVASWMGSVLTDTSDGDGLPRLGRRDLDQVGRRCATARTRTSRPRSTSTATARWAWPRAEQLHGKEMSYNNYLDTDAARRAAYDFDGPAVAIIKHANPCGIAVGADVAEAHRRAHECDPVSAFGGVIAANRPVTRRHGRAGRRDLHRGDRGPGLRRRRRRGARRQEEHPDPGLPSRSRAAASRSARSRAACSCSTVDAHRRRGRRPVDLDPRHRHRRLARGARRPRLRLAAVPRGQVQRDPARQGRRLGRRRHGPGQPRRLLQARRLAGGGARRSARSPPPTPSSRSRTARRS